MSNCQPPWYESEQEIAELLWCAAHLNRIVSPPQNQRSSPEDKPSPQQSPSTTVPSKEVPSGGLETQKTEKRVKVYANPKNAPKKALTPPSKTVSQSFSPVRLPDIFALPNPFETGKSLLPFGRRIPGKRQWDIDIHETVEQTASANGLPMIVLKPELERWFDLQILVDRSPSMEFWGFVQKWPKMGNTSTTKQAISRNDQSRIYSFC